MRSLFHRQLQVPLADVAEILDAYRAWEAENLQAGAEVSLTALKRCNPVNAPERGRSTQPGICLCQPATTTAQAAPAGQ